jgi:superfamily II DNA or RNA helicase
MIVSSKLTIPLDELRKVDTQKIMRRLTFVNDAQEVVSCYRLTDEKLILPRGAWSEIPSYIEYQDRRSCPPMPALNFTIELDAIEKDERFSKQAEALAAMFENEQGLIVRPPGTGKTQIALAFVAACKTRTLVLVHTHDILQQWADYAAEAIPGLSVGIIQGKSVEVGHLTLATVQTISKFIGGKDKKWWRQFGAVILDEAHHGPAKSFEQVLNSVPARYRFGFTASPTRADGMEPYLQWLIGPVIHKRKFTSPVDLKVVPVKTKFHYMFRGHWDWGNLVRALIVDPERNRQITEVIDAEVAKGNSILVLSRRIEQLESIAERLQCANEILTAGRGKRNRDRILHDFRKGKIHCVLATQLADEALDIPRLNRVCLVHPGKHEGRIIQQIGRALREFPGKKNVIIYDFVDYRVSVLRRQWNQRKRTYKKLKIKVKSTGTLFRKAA